MESNEMTWRKMPRNIIRDEEMDYISDQLPRELRAAPYMFYLTALCKADDDGIIDLEDGVIFSRMMRIGRPEDVFTIAQLMQDRHLITAQPGTTKIMFTSWEYPKAAKPRTLQERRNVVQRQIEEQQNTPMVDFSSLAAAPKQPARVDFSHSQPFASFFPQVFDDKNEKNVVKNPETERENREIDYTERKDTHTEDKTDQTDRLDRPHQTEQKGFQAPTQAFQPLEGRKDNRNTEEAEAQEETQEEETLIQGNDLADVALNCAQAQVENKELQQSYQAAFSVFLEFFTKNCQGNQNLDAIATLSRRITELSDERNPPEVIANLFCSQFKKLSESPGYYQGIPLTAESLVKPGPYGHVLQVCSNILNAGKQPKPEWIKQLEIDKRQMEFEKTAVCNPITQAVIKSGGIANMLAEEAAKAKGDALPP